MSDTFKQFRKLLGASSFQQATLIGFTPLLMWLYTPANFGVYALFMIAINLLRRSLALSIERSILESTDADDATRRTSRTVQICLTTGVLYIVACVALGRPIFALAVAPSLSNILFYNTLFRKDFGTITNWRIIETLTIVALQSALYQFENGLLLGHATGSILGLLYLTKMTPGLRPIGHPTRIIEFIRENNYCLKFLFPSQVLQILSNRLPIVICAQFIPLDVLGQLSIALRLVNLPSLFSGEALGMALLNTRSENKGEARILDYSYMISLATITVLSLVIYITVWFAVKTDVFTEMFPDWTQVVQYFSNLVAFGLLSLVLRTTVVQLQRKRTRSILIVLNLIGIVFPLFLFLLGLEQPTAFFYASVIAPLALTTFLIIKEIRVT